MKSNSVSVNETFIVPTSFSKGEGFKATIYCSIALDSGANKRIYPTMLVPAWLRYSWRDNLLEVAEGATKKTDIGNYALQIFVGRDQRFPVWYKKISLIESGSEQDFDKVYQDYFFIGEKFNIKINLSEKQAAKGVAKIILGKTPKEVQELSWMSCGYKIRFDCDINSRERYLPEWVRVGESHSLEGMPTYRDVGEYEFFSDQKKEDVVKIVVSYPLRKIGPNLLRDDVLVNEEMMSDEVNKKNKVLTGFEEHNHFDQEEDKRLISRPSSPNLGFFGASNNSPPKVPPIPRLVLKL
jgi:hypothetical protein